MKHQRGGTVIGLILGVLLGLLIALGVVIYVNHIPVPFMHKVKMSTAEQEAAEAQRNRNWDPNAPLYGKNPVVPRPVASEGASDAAASAPAQASPAASAPASRGSATLSTQTADDPFLYYVQAGAFSREVEAEQQRGRLALLGLEARISEREQGGKIVYRVRVGGFDTPAAAEEARGRLSAEGIESAIVKVPR